MTQIFSKAANSIARVSLLGIFVAIIFIFFVPITLGRATYITKVGLAIPQPIPFSHEHHVGGLGIDCRYCHTSVETSAFAGMPATQTCLNCHKFMWNTSGVLSLLRESWETNTPIAWNRVYDLPDFVYFNHSIHIKKGIGCVSCHGRIDTMPLTMKVHTLEMQWCLDCHRNPAPHLRSQQEIFTLTPSQKQDHSDFMALYHINKAKLTDCSICHR